MPILKSLKQHKILLDTHVLIWIMIDDVTINEEFKKVFEFACRRQAVFISPMSVWEIGMLVEKKRIELEMDVLDWIHQVIELSGIQISEMTPALTIQSTRLPGIIHGDPVDRLLIAAAHAENAVLVTADTKIIEYGSGKFVSVFNPRN